jgi:hypothetical protein
MNSASRLSRSDSSRSPLKMNFNFKVEVYPDLNSHIKTKRLEYPESLKSNTNSNNKLFDLVEASQAIESADSKNFKSLNSLKNSKRNRRQNNPLRYVTQPITLIEIKELEEETTTTTTTTTTNDYTTGLFRQNEKVHLV